MNSYIKFFTGVFSASQLQSFAIQASAKKMPGPVKAPRIHL